MSRPLARVKPAKRDADGRCIDWRCTRYGGNWQEGDAGRCVGMHCPHCDTPCSSHGHNCPNAPENPFLAIDGEAVTTELDSGANQ